jgi:hypothetical protein
MVHVFMRPSSKTDSPFVLDTGATCHISPD